MSVVENKPKHRVLVRNLILLSLVLLITFLPLFIMDSPFSGADGLAKDVITTENKDYVPWFKPIIEPSSSEVESLLFALQAACGSGVIFYILGYWRGKRQREKENSNQEETKDYVN